MLFDIRPDAVRVSRWLSDAQRRQVPFATVMAMTATAKDVKDAERSVMQRVFDRPTPYTLNALRVKPATKADPIASVEFKEFGGTPAKRFLNPEVHGGGRSQKSFERRLQGLGFTTAYFAPARGAPLNGYGNLTGGVIKKVLSQLGSQDQGNSAATGSRRSKRKRKAEAFFKHPTKPIVMVRKGGQVQPFLVGISPPTYSKRFPFYETAAGIVARRMPINFEIAFQRAMASAR